MPEFTKDYSPGQEVNGGTRTAPEIPSPRAPTSTPLFMAASRPQAACTVTSRSDDNQFIKLYSISDTYEVRAPPPTQTRGRERSISANPPEQTRGCDQYTRLRALTAASSRLVLSGVAYARPLQVPWWVAARGKYDMIIQGEHAAKQLQARARAQPCSCGPNPFRVPRCARLALINAIRAPPQDKYDVSHTTESLYYTCFQHREAGTVERLSHEMPYLSWRSACAVNHGSLCSIATARAR